MFLHHMQANLILAIIYQNLTPKPPPHLNLLQEVNSLTGQQRVPTQDWVRGDASVPPTPNFEAWALLEDAFLKSALYGDEVGNDCIGNYVGN
jgi:hypothetical protein